MKSERLTLSAEDNERVKPAALLEPYSLGAARVETDHGAILRETLTSVRRAWRGLALWVFVCVGGATAYVLLATPQFSATTQVVLEPRQPAAPMDPAASSTAPTLDSAQADSQVQVLQSERNLRFVFDTLNLAADPDFANNGFDLIGFAQSLLPLPSASPPPSPHEAAIRAREVAYRNFASHVIVKRLAQSYAFEVTYVALSAEKAARLANSITAAYIRDQVIYNVAAAAAQRGGDYLQNRISDSKTEEDVATNAVKTGVIPDYTFGHADARIISAAIEPLTKSWPMTTLTLALSMVFAMISGVGAVIVRDGLDRRIRSRAQVRWLTGIDALAVIPRARKRHRRALSLREAIDAPLSPFSHAMRVLHAIVLPEASGARYASIGFVSCHPGEGQSLIAANLAYLIAESAQPVTLIDADFRHPTLSKTLAATAVCSLGELAATRTVDAAAQKTSSGEFLSFVAARSTSGEQDPNQIVCSREMLQAMGGLAAARNVVVNLPPLSVSADSIAMGRWLTGVIVVATALKTTVDDLADLVGTLSTNGVHVLGVVLNEAAFKR
jgi:succinoglycan biosynthesis transport protein ExoP